PPLPCLQKVEMDSHMSPRAQTQSPLHGAGTLLSTAVLDEAVMGSWDSLPCKDTDATVQAPKQAMMPTVPDALLSPKPFPP
ncbi:hypothetical protein P7K49_034080, partial [Saguinus oedipus]